ncbi:MAG: aminoglycoside phosphotransferase family protein [Nannocystaceae bacterium]
MSLPDTQVVRRALGGFNMGSASEIRRFGDGLIHDTYFVEVGLHRYVLQRVNRIFAASVHANIQAVTTHLHQRGVVSPRLLDSEQGRPWLDCGAEGVWRLMTFVEGATRHVLDSPAEARSVGGTLGRFHTGLKDLRYDFVAARPPGHDRARYLQALRGAMARHSAHRCLAEVVSLARPLLETVERVRPVSEVPDVVAHGDPKLSNILFHADRSEAYCLVDLDTVGPGVWALELGDAWRSWCAGSEIGGEAPTFDLTLFAASWAGYCAEVEGAVDRGSSEALVLAPEWICLELALRFGADALEERYFAWDTRRYDSASEHNLARARWQWALHAVLVDNRDARRDVLRSHR